MAQNSLVTFGLSLAICCVVSTAPETALGQIAVPLSTITDPAPNGIGGLFGNEVTFDGNIVVVGDPLDSTRGYKAGQVYLFDLATGSLLHTLNDPTPDAFLQSNNRFGNAVAISGSRVLVGNHYDDSFGPDTGAAYLYDASNGQLLRTISPPAPQNLSDFGGSVAISDQYYAIASPSYASSGDFAAGIVDVFDSQTGSLLFTVNDPTPTVSNSAGNSFGQWIAISGDTLLVGDFFDDTNAENAGQVHLFDITNGTLLQTFNDPSPMANGRFGHTGSDISGDNVYLRSRSTAYWFDAVTGEIVEELSSAKDYYDFASSGSGVVQFSRALSIDHTYRVSGIPFEQRVEVYRVIDKLPGDYNEDGAITDADYQAWINQYGSAVDAGDGADGNGDGIVDAADYTVWRDAYSTAVAASVPEPVAAVLVVVGCAVAGSWQSAGRTTRGFR